jgi:hypothetical protein
MEETVDKVREAKRWKVPPQFPDKAGEYRVMTLEGSRLDYSKTKFLQANYWPGTMRWTDVKTGKIITVLGWR